MAFQQLSFLRVFQAFGLLLFLFCANQTFAQGEMDSLSTQDTVIVKEKKPFTKELAGYFEQTLELGPRAEGMGLSHQFGFGVFYEGFAAGFFVSESIGNESDSPFFPNKYILTSKQLGGFIGKSMYRGTKTQLYARLNLGMGSISWKDPETESDVFADQFLLMKPEVQFSYLPASFIQLFGSIGYRNTYGVKITQVNDSDYNGVTINLGFRIGYFYKPKEQ